ncbi:MAG: hypothetical protein Q9210_001839 [Variospora velana]
MASYIDPNLSKSTTLSNGITYSYAFIPAGEGKPYILFLHGFPSSAYDWRRQVSFFSKTGYGVVAPDLLGYGGTDKPSDLKPYSLKSMSDDLASLLDHHEIQSVLGVGHDWGSFLLSRMANYLPDRISAYAWLALGYYPPFGKFDVDAINDETQRMLGYSTFGYWHFFNAPDAAEIMISNPEISRSLCYSEDPMTLKNHLCPKGAIRKAYEEGFTSPRPAWLSEDEITTHSKIFSAENGGYRGGLNWYKAQMANVNAADEDALPTERHRIDKPTLLITCKKDYVCVPVLQEEQMKPLVKDMEIESLDCGHWVPLEAADEVNRILQDFFDRHS